MQPPQPSNFMAVADHTVRGAFLHGHPETVEWLVPGTKLCKWTVSVVSSRGVSPWWQFLETRRLANGVTCPGLKERKTWARNLSVHDREYARTRSAVTRQWNSMNNLAVIELVGGAWGYIGKTSGQLLDKCISNVYLIGGEYQVWIPTLTQNIVREIPAAPYNSTE